MISNSFNQPKIYYVWYNFILWKCYFVYSEVIKVILTDFEWGKDRVGCGNFN